nr:RNA-directed DNA polymerase, eukaryota, reverse transcriptase zinc-binding domain protein [Tanacetum cinerariifolium]
MPFIISDHSDALTIIPNFLKKKRKSFRFTNYIFDRKESILTMEKEWKTEIEGHKMYRVVKKLKAMKQPMKKLNWKNGNLIEKVDLWRERLKATQRLMEKYPHYDKVKAKEAGRKENEIEDHNLFTNKLSDAEALYMISSVSDKEIKEPMFDIGENRAPGPHGFTYVFFKHSWSIIRKDICEALKEFFDNGKLLGEINATLVTLIPKILQPNKVSDFKPIACCNNLYKCISKILTSRIKGGLDKLVNFNQSIFITGRVIQDNLMITQELLEGKVKESSKFKFHKECKEMKPHISFADDLLVLSHGDVESMKVIKDALLEFSNAYGLKPNMEKSVVFFGSVKEGIKQQILDVLPFKVGKIPVKYLGEWVKFARNCTVRPRRRDAAYLQTQLLIAQKEEARIQLQAEEFDLMAAAADLDEIKEVNANCILMANLLQASISDTKTDKALVYDSDESAEYTELLEPIPEPHQVPQNDHNVIFENLAIEVEKVNPVNRKLKETNADLTTELSRFKNQEKCFEISQEKYDKLERCYQQSDCQEQCLSKKINALHLSTGKQIMTLNEQISDLNKQLSKEKSTVSFLLEEKKKLKSDFKICEDELLDKQIQLEKRIKELNNILVKINLNDSHAFT